MLSFTAHLHRRGRGDDRCWWHKAALCLKSEKFIFFLSSFCIHPHSWCHFHKIRSTSICKQKLYKISFITSKHASQTQSHTILTAFISYTSSVFAEFHLIIFFTNDKCLNNFYRAFVNPEYPFQHFMPWDWAMRYFESSALICQHRS